MQLAAHELSNLSELITSCYNTVSLMGNFIQQVEDTELKQILERQFPLHIKDYNLKVEFVQNHSTPNIHQFQPDQLHPNLENYTEASQLLSSVTPRTNAQSLNDREIATAYLLNQKAAAKNYAAAVLETSNPNLRTFLENAFLNSSRHAYEVWQYMTKKGWYPLMAAPQPAIQTVASMYQPVNSQSFIQ